MASQVLRRGAWAFGPPIKHENLALAGGTALPDYARLTCFLGTGRKGCATNSRNFSKQKGGVKRDGSAKGEARRLMAMGTVSPGRLSGGVVENPEVNRQQSG
jgi:hypothetical protein